MNAPVSHPTRALLLAAGLRLAEREGLGGMSVNAIVREAGVAKGTFYVHFPERKDYFVALHRDFHDGLERAVRGAIGDARGGKERLRVGVEAYLDGCLAARGVKVLLLEARTEPAVGQEVHARNRKFSQRAQREFAALGWPEPAHAARLFVAMAAEAALAEVEAGARLPGLRATLMGFIERYTDAGITGSPP